MSFQSSTCAALLSLCSPGSLPFDFFDCLLGGEKNLSEFGGVECKQFHQEAPSYFVTHQIRSGREALREVYSWQITLAVS